MSSCKVLYEVEFNIKENLLCCCAKEVMRREGVCGDISIVFVSYDKIKRMNKIFFGKDVVTDVLSFQEKDNINNGKKDNSYLGEILICPEFLNNKTDLCWEVLHLVTHGTFHLIGKHHEDFEDGYNLIHKQEVEIIDYVIKKVK